MGHKFTGHVFSGKDPKPGQSHQLHRCVESDLQPSDSLELLQDTIVWHSHSHTQLIISLLYFSRLNVLCLPFQPSIERVPVADTLHLIALLLLLLIVSYL